MSWSTSDPQPFYIFYFKARWWWWLWEKGFDIYIFSCPLFFALHVDRFAIVAKIGTFFYPMSCNFLSFDANWGNRDFLSRNFHNSYFFLYNSNPKGRTSLFPTIYHSSVPILPLLPLYLSLFFLLSSPSIILDHSICLSSSVSIIFFYLHHCLCLIRGYWSLAVSINTITK